MVVNASFDSARFFDGECEREFFTIGVYGTVPGTDESGVGCECGLSDDLIVVFGDTLRHYIVREDSVEELLGDLDGELVLALHNTAMARFSDGTRISRVLTPPILPSWLTV